MKPFPYDYAVIGGDLRQVYLVRELARRKKRVCHFALCCGQDNTYFTDTPLIFPESSLSAAVTKSAAVIGPLPLCRGKDTLNQSAVSEKFSTGLLLSLLSDRQKFFAGVIPEDFQSRAEKKGVLIHDFMKDEVLATGNSIATAEGVICEAILKSPQNLHHSCCAVLGYGRCGRTLVQYLKGMSCQVYVFSRNPRQKAEASIHADYARSLKALSTEAGKFDFIFNTIPAPVITKEILYRMKPDSIILDLASAPGGVSLKEAADCKIKAFQTPGLPGKYAPAASARLLRQSMETALDSGS